MPALLHPVLQVLSKELSRWIADPLWAEWGEVLNSIHYDPDSMSTFLGQYTEWHEAKLERA